MIVNDGNLLTGSVGVFVKEAQEMFIKDFQVVSLSKEPYVSVKVAPREVEVLKQKASKKLSIFEKQLSELSLEEFDIKQCMDKAKVSLGCGLFSDHSCEKMACTRCCYLTAKAKGNCGLTCGK